MEVLDAKSEETLKPIEDSESSSWSTILIDVLERPSSYKGRKDSPVQILVSLWKTSHGIAYTGT